MMIFTKAVAIAGAALLALGTVGCSGQRGPTCAEYAGMGPNTGLFVAQTADQKDALKAALKAEGLDTGLVTLTLASAQVLAYCNIVDGVAYQNEDEAIANAL